jgi:hypothetical protein
VDDEHDGQLPAFSRAREVTFDRAVPGRGWHDLVAHLDALVVGRHLLRPRVVGAQALEDGRDGQAADRESAGAVEESAAVDVAVLVFVEEV